MARYEIKQSTLPPAEGAEPAAYPRMVVEGRMETAELIALATQNTTFGAGETAGMLLTLLRRLAAALGQGYSVHIDGLGTFTASLRVKKRWEDGERVTPDARHVNAVSIEVGGVNFKADKDFVREVNLGCKLRRSGKKPRQSSARYTEAERLDLARQFLASHGEMALWQYCALTGLLKSTASRELRRWEDDPATGICGTGRGIGKRWRLG